MKYVIVLSLLFQNHLTFAQTSPAVPKTANVPVAPPADAVPGSIGDVGGPSVNPSGSALTFKEDLSDILEEFKYDPSGRRDPFLPFSASRGVYMASIGPVMPLQKYEIEKLRLVGVMWDVRRPRAMIKTPSGDVFTVQKDTRVGTRNGYVAQIRNGEIIIVETIETEGKTLYQTRIIRVAKDEVKGPS